jgi:hypothetical protein
MTPRQHFDRPWIRITLLFFLPLAPEEYRHRGTA